MRFPAALLLSLFVPCLEGMLQCAAEEGETPPKQFLVDRKEKEQSRQWVIPIPTFGGLQVWTDFSYRQGYRIQHNAVTDSWRLLDGNDRRWMWGTRRQCEAFLDNVSKRSQSKIRNKHCIVLVHGLMRTKHSMTPLKKVLQKKCDCEIVCFSYASTRGKIGAHAAALREFLESLPETWTLSFVGHSMGNIVIRHFIADLQDDQKQRSNQVQSPIIMSIAIQSIIHCTGQLSTKFSINNTIVKSTDLIRCSFPYHLSALSTTYITASVLV